MINRVILTGRLTRDPELRKTTTGKNVVSFSIAVDRRFKGQDGTDADFFRVSAWGQTAEFVGNYLTKGRLVAVEGRLQQHKYTSNSGESKETVEVVADSVTSLDRPRDRGGEEASESGRPSSTPSAGAIEAEYDPFEDE